MGLRFSLMGLSRSRLSLVGKVQQTNLTMIIARRIEARL